jgi:hypothetical protein
MDLVRRRSGLPGFQGLMHFRNVQRSIQEGHVLAQQTGPPSETKCSENNVGDFLFDAYFVRYNLVGLS